jgi:hypothetical protein
MRWLRLLFLAVMSIVTCAEVSSLAYAAMTQADFITGLPEKILSQCGLLTAVFAAGTFYFATGQAKARTQWLDDRKGMMTIIRAQDDNFNKLSVAHAKLEGMLLAAQRS